jgi:hypothetical protein
MLTPIIYLYVYQPLCCLVKTDANRACLTVIMYPGICLIKRVQLHVVNSNSNTCHRISNRQYRFNGFVGVSLIRRNYRPMSCGFYRSLTQPWKRRVIVSDDACSQLTRQVDIPRFPRTCLPDCCI